MTSVPQVHRSSVVGFGKTEYSAIVSGLRRVIHGAGRDLAYLEDDIIAETMYRYLKLANCGMVKSAAISCAKGICRNVIRELRRVELPAALRVPVSDERGDDEGNSYVAEIADTAPELAEETMDKETLLNVLARIASELSEDDQEMFNLALLESQSHEQIAAALGISPGASRTRLSRLLAKLRGIVAEIEI